MTKFTILLAAFALLAAYASATHSHAEARAAGKKPGLCKGPETRAWDVQEVPTARPQLRELV